MLKANDNMLLRIAQGDAYGMAYEYVDDTKAPGLREQLLKFEGYCSHPTYHKLPAGTYTDDTQMSIAVSEALLFNKNGDCDDLSAENFMDRFFVTFKRDPRNGYSRQFQRILEESRTLFEFKTKLVPCSDANGAAMRSVPLGVLKDPQEVVRVAQLQAACTHANGGIEASVAVALMSHFALHDPREFSDFLSWGIPYCPAMEPFREAWVGRVKARGAPGDLGVGMNTAWAVHTLLVQQQSLKGIACQTIEWGGDTDSVLAIAWGIASCRMQDEVLPTFLEDDLEKLNASKYGPQFLKDLGRHLMAAYDSKENENV